MSENRKPLDYFQKASIYDLLACYYKYTNPAMHVYFYQKHLNSLNKALQMTNTSSFPQMYRPAGQAAVRVIHAAPGAPNVDVYVNGNKLLADFPYKKLSEYMPIPAGKYQIDIYPAGNMTETLISKKVTVEPGKSYTLAVIKSDKFLRLLSFSNDPRVPAGETKVRFIHLSPDAPAVDIAVKNGDVVFSNVSYRQTTDYLGLTPMTVDLEARVAGSKNIVLPLPGLRFSPNEAYTVFAVGYAKEEPVLEAIVAKD